MDKLRIAYFGTEHNDTDYIGVDGSSLLKNPMTNELVKLGHEITFIGTEPERYRDRNFPILNILKINKEDNFISVRDKIKIKHASKFTIKELNGSFDVLFMVCRMDDYPEQLPDWNLQNFLIEKFEGVILMCDNDLYARKIPQELHNKIVLLRPYVKENLLKFKNQYEFHFFTNTMRKFQHLQPLVDFCYCGNVYRRWNKFEKFFGQVQKTKTVMVTGNFLRKKDRNNSLKLENILYCGQTPHYCTIPFLSAGNATIEIVPPLYETFGLMTMRIWEALMAGILCFGDKEIYAIDKFIPKELIAKNGNEVVEIYNSLDSSSTLELYFKFVDMHKENTLDNRVQDLLKIIDMELNKI